jgi:hypothetical protein
MRIRVCGRSVRVLTSDAAPRSGDLEEPTLEQLAKLNRDSVPKSFAEANRRDWDALKALNKRNQDFWSRGGR